MSADPTPAWTSPVGPVPLEHIPDGPVALLHARYDALRGAIVIHSDRLSDFERALDDLRAQLAALLGRPSCSLCATAGGTGCESETCRARA